MNSGLRDGKIKKYGPVFQFDPWLERGVEPPEIPEITQFKLGQAHTALWMVAALGSSGKPLKTEQRADLGHDLEVFHHEAGHLVHIPLIDDEEHLRARLVRREGERLELGVDAAKVDAGARGGCGGPPTPVRHSVQVSQMRSSSMIGPPPWAVLIISIK